MKLSPADRERTPPLFAQWLVLLASRCGRPQLQPAGCNAELAAVTSSQARCNSDLVSAAAAKRAAFRAWAGAA